MMPMTDPLHVISTVSGETGMVVGETKNVADNPAVE